jgi:hypothetical protein
VIGLFFARSIIMADKNPLFIKVKRTSDRPMTLSIGLVRDSFAQINDVAGCIMQTCFA